MNKKIIILLLVFSLSALMGGCWSRSEIVEEAIVLGTGVDWTEDGQIRLTVQIASPGAFIAGGEAGVGGTQAPAWVVWAEGKTIQDAERYLAMKVPREIYWGHSVILVIGEEMARQGTSLVTNFFTRFRQPREIMWFMVARGEAKKVLEAQPWLSHTSAQAVGFLTRMETGFSVHLWEYGAMLSNKGVQPVVTAVAVKEVAEARGPGAEGKAPAQQGVELSGVGVFKEDRLIGWLDPNETRGLLWLKGKAQKGAITVPSPGEPEREVSIEIRRSSTKIEPEYDGENLCFNVKIYVEGDMVEQQSRVNLATPEHSNALESAMSEEIKNRCIITLEKAQWEYGVDIFGFGEAFHRKYKKDWLKLQNNWDEEFSRAGVNITVEAHVREIGLLTAPASVQAE
ncbi:Spore germination protein B3 precursor [Sporotomaculum syntrophicum]|uniref:Spore germination protein B3 n=1 Tax=Sporotomaculum syntrophicum TaxID=182264 RepID=A0A9D2WSN7_9FIRM|nr:Ger(x)C family spore germination protein [Sporotomaculum syntrophicum]KAF1086724.1 Spore germination protein B3 precursor [Sporotomaculum syntrophicum]